MRDELCRQKGELAIYLWFCLHLVLFWGCWHISIPKHTHPQFSALGIFKMLRGRTRIILPNFLWRYKINYRVICMMDMCSANLLGGAERFSCKTPGTCYLVITKRSKLSLFGEWFFRPCRDQFEFSAARDAI
jgi:hypothetical protein